MCSLGPHLIPIPGTSNPTRVKENDDAVQIELTEEELKEIAETIEANEVKGNRYGDAGMAGVWG